MSCCRFIVLVLVTAWTANVGLLGVGVRPAGGHLGAVPAAHARQIAAPAPSLLETSDEQRQRYLGTAVIWEPGDVPTPEQLRQGPADRNPLRGITLNTAGEIACRYTRGGAASAGKTAKFTCLTESGQSIRVKYYDGNAHTGNREVFAEVAATRLFWALGFDADATFPVTIRCLDCPSDPMNGTGARASRRYLGIVEALYEGTVIGSSTDLNQGWSFGEVLQAIESLPPSEQRTKQRTHFEALSLLAVFVQHGDRKPTQQRLICRTSLDLSAGDLQAVDDEAGFHLPVLFEHEDAQACSQSGLTIQDLGATFGSAGQFTTKNAKVHLSSWAAMPVFATPTTLNAPCRGNITVSGSAGPGAEENPRISEAGRHFLYERLSALTPEHVRAIFEAARLNELDEPQQWRDHESDTLHSGLDAWVAVFLHKVDEIGRTSCRR